VFLYRRVKVDFDWDVAKNFVDIGLKGLPCIGILTKCPKYISEDSIRVSSCRSPANDPGGPVFFERWNAREAGCYYAKGLINALKSCPKDLSFNRHGDIFVLTASDGYCSSAEIIGNRANRYTLIGVLAQESPFCESLNIAEWRIN